MTISEQIRTASALLKNARIESPRLDAQILFGFVLGVSRERLILDDHLEITLEQAQIFADLIARRAKNEPIAYIIAKKEFLSLDFIVNHDTLIPRPDSEILVEVAIKLAKDLLKIRAETLQILDIGTGSGCLPIAFLSEIEQAYAVAVDISEGALQIAKQNAALNKVSDRIGFVRSNWCDSIKGKFDIILSNPPYIKYADAQMLASDVVDFEPHKALFADSNGLAAYEILASQVKERLNSQGYVLFEVGDGQAPEVANILQKVGLKIEAIEKDLAGKQRCVIASNIQ
ncbi:MAG: peptide chain release factor N(5)-glutamine methyltransferase [Pseudomonadota bacterium]